jgi:flagellin FlaB
MLKKIGKVMRGERGITGLETAIILIAFVVVASVFAYTVLSAGIFSSQKGKEAIYTGLSEARSSLTLKGELVARDTNADGKLNTVTFMLTNALNGEAIDMTPTAGGNNVTVISYTDKTQHLDNLSWTVVKLGMDDGDDLLEPGETFEVTVNVASANVGAYTTFSLEVKPPVGSVLVIEATTPAVVDAINILH